MDQRLASLDHPISPDGSRRPAVLIFDVNETLPDMTPLASRFEAVGAPAHQAARWFAELLRDGFALAVNGTNAPFAALAAQALHVRLAGHPLDRPLDDAVAHVMAGFAELEVHPDVPEGLAALSDLGVRLVTLSNGSTEVADRLLSKAGVRNLVDRVLSVEQAAAWKPAGDAYAYALGECGVDPMDAMMVAVHPWDIDGAACAGLATAWINRTQAPYPSYFRAPDLEAASLRELADALR